MVRTVLLDDYQDSVQQGCELEKQYGRKRLPLKILAEVNGDGVYMAVILLVLYRVVVVGSVALSQLAIIVGANWRFREALMELVKAITGLPEQSMHMDKVREFVDYPVAAQDGLAQPEAFERLEFRNVSFGYAGGPDVLKDVSFVLTRGEKVALVGENGAGKSTLIKLMLGLYRPRRGEVLYNGRNILALDPKRYREHFGVVFQDYTIFAESVRDNVVCGAEGAEADVRFEQAIDFADFRRKLTGFENGAQTVLSREFDEQGVDLSGGERQKVAIARAWYRQAEVLVMDEPSSALDPLAEMRLKNNLLAEKNRTLFIISHRLSTTRQADRILVLDGGQVCESGTHEELMRRGGRYAKAFSTQAQKFQ